MSITSAVIDAMVAAGCTAKQLAAAIRADEAVDMERTAKQREQNRIRQQNYRARNALSRVTTGDTPSPLGPPPPLASPPPPIIPHPLTSSLGSDVRAAPKKSPRFALSTVLDDFHADAVIDHRQRIKRPLTPHAAHLLAGKFAKCPDPNAAADAMVANGWQGFEPKWMESRTSNARGPPQPDTMLDAVRRSLEREQELERDHGQRPPANNSDDHGNHDGPWQTLLGFDAPKRETR